MAYVIRVHHHIDSKGAANYYTGKRHTYGGCVYAESGDDLTPSLPRKEYFRLCDARRAINSLNRRCANQTFGIEEIKGAAE